jgi:hypothetical protein
MFEKDEPEVTDDLMHLIPHTTLLAPHCITLAQATFPALLRLLVTLLTATAPRINPTAPATRVLAGTLWPIAVRVPPGPAFTEVNAVLPPGSKRLDHVTCDQPGRLTCNGPNSVDS